MFTSDHDDEDGTEPVMVSVASAVTSIVALVPVKLIFVVPKVALLMSTSSGAMPISCSPAESTMLVPVTAFPSMDSVIPLETATVIVYFSCEVHVCVTICPDDGVISDGRSTLVLLCVPTSDVLCRLIVGYTFIEALLSEDR